MIKVLVFIGLKIVEVSLLYFIPMWLGGLPKVRKELADNAVTAEYYSKWKQWGTGMLITIMLGCLLALLVLIILWNIELAGMVMKYMGWR